MIRVGKVRQSGLDPRQRARAKPLIRNDVTADVSVGVSLAMTILFLLICLAVVWWIFKTGYRLKS